MSSSATAARPQPSPRPTSATGAFGALSAPIREAEKPSTDNLITRPPESLLVNWRGRNGRTHRGTLSGGKPFIKNRLDNLLTSIAYIGKIEHGGQIYDGEHEGIFGPEVCQLCRVCSGPTVAPGAARFGTSMGRCGRAALRQSMAGPFWPHPRTHFHLVTS